MGVTNQLVLTINTNFIVQPTASFTTDVTNSLSANATAPTVTADLTLPTVQSDVSYSTTATVDITPLSSTATTPVIP